MATTTTNGTITSFGNTPQATDDLFLAATTGLTEDSTNIVYLDVMANDLGGNAKTLFSIDDGISSGGTRPADLLTQDTGRAEAVSTDTSLNGAKIWITSDGKVGYDSNTLSAAFKDQLQHLNAGQYMTDSFTYAIRLGNGTLSWATATVQIAGVNDAPVVTSTVKGTAVEDGSKVTMNALANASDVDTGTVLQVVNVPATLPAGVSYDATNHAFTLDPSNAAYQHLAAGQTTTVTVSYGVSDGVATTAASVSFTITGTNDAPVVTSAVTGSAVEDGAKVTLNALANASDVDDGAVLTVVNVPSSLPAGVAYDAATHSFTLDPSNAAYQHLAAGQTTTVTVNYGVSDGIATTGASVSFTITGTNDAPVVSGAVTGNAVEDGAKVTLNALANASDVDDGTTLSVVNVPASLPSGVSYDAATHSFTLDPTNAAYQHLAAGATTTVMVNYGVSDGITTTVASVSFTVTGTNDAPVVSSAVTGSAVEDGAKVTLNALANASDVDDGAVLSVVNVPASLPAGVSYDAVTHSFTLDPTNAAYQSLAAGQTTTVTVNYGVSDGIATTAASASFTVTGTNDVPVVTNTSAATVGSVKEDATTTVSGQLSASDVDQGATQSWSVHGSDTGTYGSIAVDANGKWTYTLNNGAANVQALAQGESHDETFTIRVTDDQGAYVDQTLTVTVNGTNDAPVVTGAVTSGATEDGSVVTLNALAHASDLDNGTTLAVTNVPATLPAGVTYDAGTQSYTLDPSDAAYQHLAQGQTTVVTVNYGVTDGIATTAASVSFTVTGTNDAPVVTGAVTGAATEDGTTATVHALANASDVDDSTVLAVTNVQATLPAGVTYDAVAQTFTLDPSDAAYQHLAQGQTTVVTVNYGVTDGIATIAASVSFTVTGTNDAPVVTGAVTGTATEDGATATVNALANASDVDDSTVLAVTNLPVTLPAGVTYDAVAQTFMLDPSDAAYQHLAQGQTTVVTVNYGVTDGIATTAASVSFTVTGTNDAPVITGAVTGNATEDGSPATLNALANASDVDDSTTLSVVNVPASLPAGVSYDTATHSFSLDPSDSAYQALAQGETTTVTVNYGVTDGIATTPASVSFTVTGTNDTPVVTNAASELAGSAKEDTVVSASGQLSASDVDHGATQTWSVQGGDTGAYGSIAVDASGKWTYTLNNSADNVQALAAGESHDENFTIRVTDDHGAYVDQTVTVTVTGTNDTPVVTNAAAETAGSVQEDVVTAISGQLSASDVDHGATQTWSVQGGDAGTYGSIAVDASGKWTYSLNNDASNVQSLAAGESHDETFTVRVTDDKGAYVDQTVTVTVSGTNDAPIVTGTVTGSATEDHNTVTLDALANASDVDHGTTLSVVDVPASLPAGVSYDATSHSFTLDPSDNAYQHLAQGQTTTVTINYSVSDSITTTPAAVSFTITGTNDAPVVTGAVTGSATEDGSTATLNALANASDVDDNTVLAIVGMPVSLPAGVSYDAATHSFTLDPAADAFQSLAQGETTTVTVNYGVSDGITTTSASVSWTVTGTNDAPVVTNTAAELAGSVQEDSTTTISGQLSASDVDHNATQAWSVQGGDTGTYGSISVDANGKWTYTLNNDASNVQSLAQGESHDESFTIRVTDDQGAFVDQNVTVTVTGTNDAPVVSGTVSGNATEDQNTVTLNALANASDVDNGASLSVVNLPASLPAGVSYDTASHSFTLDPSDAAYQHLAQGQTETVTVSYGVSDGMATTAAAVSFTITGTNDAPVVTGAVTETATEDGATSTVNALANASDVDDNTVLAVTNVPVTLPAGITYDAAAQTFTLDPSDGAYQHLAQGQTTVVTVNYGVTDGLATTAASVSFTVTGTNDAPVVTGAVTGNATEDSSTVTLNALANASDVDDNTTLSVTNIATLPAGVTFDANTHNFTLDPSDAAYQHLAQGQTTTVTVSYEVSDGITTTPASVSFTVTGTNDAPIAQAKSDAATEGGAIVQGNVTATDVDDNTSLSYSLTATAPAGLVFNSDGSYSFDPTVGAYDHLKAGATQDVVVNYQVSDGIATDTNTLTITVTGTNDAPVVSGVVSGNATEDSSHVTLNALANASDVDDGTTLSVVNVPASLPAGVTYDATTHAFTLDPTDTAYQHLAQGQTAVVTVNYGVTDGIATTAASVSFTITGTNDAPVVSGAVTGNATEDGSTATLNALANASDVDDSTTLSVVNVPSLPAGVSYDAATHAFTLNPADAAFQSLVAGQTTTVTVNYGVSDGIATTNASVSWTVTGTNDVPVISGTASGGVTEDVAVSGGNLHTNGALSIVDADQGQSSFALQSGTAGSNGYGNFTLDASGNWTYTANDSQNAIQQLGAGQTLTDSFTAVSSDGTASRLVTVTITGTNDAPVITSGTTASTPENVSTSTAVYTVTATDIDGPSLTYSLSGTDASLFNIDSGTGAVTFKTSPNYEAPADAGGNNVYDIVVHANDGTADTTKAVAITVTDVSETPTTTISNIHISSDTGSSSSDFITKTAAQTITATLSAPLAAGESVLGSIDGGATWSAVTSVSGTSVSWNATLSGSSAIEFKVVNTDNQSGPVAIQSYVLDTTIAMPTVSGFSTDSATLGDHITSDNTLVITGTAEAGSSVTVKDGTTVLGTVTADNSGAWSFGPSAALTDGTHNFTAVSTDVAGNSATSSVFAVTIDTSAPNAPVISSINDNVTPVTGTVANNGFSNDTTPTLSGTAEANSTVTIKDGTSTLGTATADGSGNWNFTTAALTQGAHSFTATATDQAGNVSGSSTAYAETIDTTAPTAAVAITAIASDTGSSSSDFITNDTSLTVSGTNGALGSGEKVQVSSDGGTTWADATVTSTTWSYIDPTAHSTSFTYQVRVVDLAGNVGNTSSHAVTIDTTAPTAAVAITAIASDTGVSGDFITSDTSLTVSGTNGTLGSGEKVQVSSDGGTTWGDATVNGNTWSLNDPTTHSTSFTYQVRIVDTAGNVDANTASKAITIDTSVSAPASLDLAAADDTGVSNTDNITKNTSGLTISGTGENGATVTLFDDANGNGTQNGNEATLGTGTVSNGTFSIDIALTAGTHHVAAFQTDVAGNVSGSSTLDITVDTTPPSAAVAITAISSDTGSSSSDFITNDTSLTVSGTNGTLSSGDKVQVSSDGGTTWADATVTNTTWSYTDSTTHSASFNYQVRVVDIADNVGNTASHAVTIDTTAPTVTISENPNLTNTVGATTTLTFQFSETVTGFTASDITATRGTISNFTAVDGDTYTATFTRTAAGNANVNVAAGSYSDVAGNSGAAGGSGALPAGIAGEPINLGLADPTPGINDTISYTIHGVPVGWTLSAGTNNGDGSWSIQTNDPSALTITTPADFVGATMLAVTYTWTNVDGSTGSALLADNVEAYAPGSPIFAMSSDDHLTGSSGSDLFVFAQPITNDVVHNFDLAADKIDLVGFSSVSGFNDLQIANDVAGNAVIMLASGETITLLGVDAGALTAGNFVFDQEPVMTNAGTMTVNDGAMLPIGGIIDNNGTIVLGSTNDSTELEILVKSVTLQGGGQLVMSDNANNIIYGGTSDATLDNIDNTISGAGQIGQGQMTLVNEGIILANGSNALVIDTGIHAVTNSGTLEATGSGGLIINGDLSNNGLLWANDGNITVEGNVSGTGSALIGGSATIEFGNASSEDTTFADIGNGTLKLDQSTAYTGTVSGFNEGDRLDLADILSGPGTTINFTENDAGTGGTLTLSDGTHTTAIKLQGQYSVDGFHISADSGAGTIVSYLPTNHSEPAV